MLGTISLPLCVPSLNGEFIFLWCRAHVKLRQKKPWKGSHGRCWKDREKHLPQSQNGLCYDWFTFRVPSNHTETCPVDKKRLFTWYWYYELAWEHRTGIQKDSKNPQGTSCGNVWSERGIWLKVFFLAEYE